MRLSEPRVQPLPLRDLSDDALAALGRERDSDAPLLNIFATLAHHPKLMKRWLSPLSCQSQDGLLCGLGILIIIRHPPPLCKKTSAPS